MVELEPPGLGFSLTADGVITEVFGQVAAYAGLAPGDTVLSVNATRLDPNYIDAWVRRRDGPELIPIWLSDPTFGSARPPADCPARFLPLYGNAPARRAHPSGAASWSRSRDVAISGAASYSAEESAHHHRAAWANVERLRRAAIEVHPDKGGHKVEFQRRWAAYEAALAAFMARWKRKPAA
jgi:hypothetical protein